MANGGSDRTKEDVEEEGIERGEKEGGRRRRKEEGGRGRKEEEEGTYLEYQY